MKLRATLVTLLLCLVSTTWSETFEEAGATGRGPRIVEQKSDSTCKQETNWQVCSDDDWGPKCPSGCRIAGLSDSTDKEFSNRIDAIKKKLKDGQNSHDLIDIRTKDVYKIIRDKLVAAQQTDGSYNQVSESLRQKIDVLKVKVSRQIERIKLLQGSLRDQVVEIKRLEVDIDIKLRACKGSCAKGVDFHVDGESYENIQKQLLQAESTDLRPNVDPVPILKMRPMKDSTVDSKYKALAQEKEKFPLFSDINQYSFVLEGRSKEVTGQPVSTSPVGGGVKQPSQTTEFVVNYNDKTAQPSKTGGTVTSESRVISCTKTIQKKIVKGPTGTREEISEVISGGEECEKLEKLKEEGKGELSADGTYTIRVTGGGSSGGFNIPSWEEFISGKTVSGGSSSVSGGSKTQGSDNADVDFDDFSHIDLGSPSFTPVKTSSTSTKTVYSSSSTKDGYESSKQLKSGPVFEDLGPIQHENSDEDIPDFSARSIPTGVKNTDDCTVKGNSNCGI
ncbi:hypothetical protein GDO81_000508 [Engystomops pustulosus]|uniref:Fibrinogen alpha/beta/gamma chain coiled coil domain-containing protein n=1 Tax=Engystomops pustulosus TaxID=76066 RepID=A0AAV7D5K8_ENGPU|nr:hypothetical protein GDO81_000508 [Engystomops pustulosus]KAG8592457.1 hypothetical protein GDO81_000508 [Engystomops pustulosus]KAG8592458.1 hypothetical protein GDO81_000508 [Engystomops pustulosus]KAG8592459.1 hypothetical protein GDO81_000508 [Engystomops pustulosus]